MRWAMGLTVVGWSLFWAIALGLLGGIPVGLSLTARRPLYIFQWLSCCINLRRCH
jgi:hypothetical protein